MLCRKMHRSRCVMNTWRSRSRYQKLATVTDVVDHIDHVVQVIGIDYVGIGTDFDGGGGVDGCRTCCRNEKYYYRTS